MARHRRHPRRRGNPLYDPSQQLSGSRLRRAANQVTNLEFGPQQAALNRSMQQTTRQGTALAGRASDYYHQLARGVAKSVARQQAIGADLSTRLKSASSDAQQSLSQIDQDAAQRAMQDTAVRGAGLGGGGQARVAAEVAASRGLAAASAQSAQELGALETTNWANLQNVAGLATSARGGEVQGQLLNALSAQQADIRGKQNDLSAQYANKRMQNLLQMRQQGFENTLAAQGIGVDLAKIRADMQQTRAQTRLARARIHSTERQNRQRLRSTERMARQRLYVTKRGQDISAFTQRRGQDVTAREKGLDRASREKIAAGRNRLKGRAGHAETTDSRKSRLEISNILAEIGTNNWFRGKPKDRVLQHLSKMKASPLGAEIAYQLHITGWLGPELERRARAAGIRIPKAWRHPGGPYGSGIPHGKV